MEENLIKNLINKKVQIKVFDNILYIGLLKGLDQNLNLFLTNTYIRTIENKKLIDKKENDLIIKGDTVIYISEIDLEKEISYKLKYN